MFSHNENNIANKHSNRFRLQQPSAVSAVTLVPQHWSEGHPRFSQPRFHWAQQRLSCPPLHLPLFLHHHRCSLRSPASHPGRWWTGRGSVPSAAYDTCPSPPGWLRIRRPPPDSSINSTRRYAATGWRESDSFHEKLFAKKLNLWFKSKPVKIQSWKGNVFHPFLKASSS